MAKQIYLVTNSDGSDSEGLLVYGAFSTKKNAKKWLANNYPDNQDSFDISWMPVDAGIQGID